MAKDVQSKKRKASVPEADAKKMKKDKEVTIEAAGVPVKKRKATEDAAPVMAKKSKTPKPALRDASKPKPAKEVTSNKAAENTNGDVSKGIKSAAKELKQVKAIKSKDSKQSKPIEPPSDDKEANDDEVEDEDDDSEIDDQTEALLKGFESDGDDQDAEKEGGLEEGQEVPEVPSMSNRSKKKLQSAIDFKKDEKPGVVYVGRIPHGFYEHEMREYFKQFGTILKLRMSRNRKTGESKHIAWIQFESATVAEIVARTMDNYLLFNHILKVKLVPDEQVPANLWKGANRRFKKVPWNKIEGRKLAQAKPEDAWEKQNARVQKKRDEKAAKMKEIGYEFEAPALKSAKGIGKKAVEQPALVAYAEAETKAISAAPAPEDSKKKDKEKKKEQKSKAIEASKAAAEVAAKPVANASVAPITEEPSKPKKEKKRKVAEVEDASAATSTVARAESVEKELKSKKPKISGAESSGEASEKVKKPKKNKEVKATT